MTDLSLSVLTSKQDRVDYVFEPAIHTQRGGTFNIHGLIEKLPRSKRGWVHPGYRYASPGNNFEGQLDENDHPKPNHLPKNE